MNSQASGKQWIQGVAVGLAALAMGTPFAQGQTPLFGSDGQGPGWIRHDLSGGIRSVSYSPDGALLAYSASSDRIIQIRRVADGALVRSLTADTRQSFGVDQVAFAPGGEVGPTGFPLASTWNRTSTSGGYSFTFGGLEIWPPSAPPSIQTGPRASYAGCLAWAPDGRSIVSGSPLILWDAATGDVIRRFNHGASIQSVAFSPNGEYIASGGADHVTKVWRASDGSLVHTLTGHTDYVNALAFSADGAVLASGAGGLDYSGDHSIKLWRVSDGALLGTILGHGNWVMDLSFALSGRVLVSASLDGTIRFWRTADGVELFRRQIHSGLPLCLDIAPDQRTYAYGLNNGTVVLSRL